MSYQNNELEEQCEDAVFQICCTRERYSVRSANQLEKQLALIRKNITAPVQKGSTPTFKIPIITEDQEELFQKFKSSSKAQKSNAEKESHKNILSKLKELESVLNLIERSKNSEMHKLLTE